MADFLSDLLDKAKQGLLQLSPGTPSAAQVTPNPTPQHTTPQNISDLDLLAQDQSFIPPAIKTFIKNPIKSAGGMVNAASKLADSVVQGAANEVQNISPSVLGPAAQSTVDLVNKVFGKNLQMEDPPQSASEQIFSIANNVPIPAVVGLPGAIRQGYRESLASAPSTPDAEDKFVKAPLAGIANALKGVIPIDEAKLFLSNSVQNPDGSMRDPTEEELGEAFLTGGLKSALVAHVMSRATSGRSLPSLMEEDKEGALLKVITDKTISAGEILAANEKSGGAKVQVADGRIQPISALGKTDQSTWRGDRYTLQSDGTLKKTTQVDPISSLHEQAQAIRDKAETDSDLLSGVASVPLSAEGEQLVADLRKKVVGLDQIFHSPTLRAEQTARILSQPTLLEQYKAGIAEGMDPRDIPMGTPIPMIPDSALGPQAIGALEGKPIELARPILEDYLKNKPDEPLPFIGQMSKAPGESFNAAIQRQIDGFQAHIDHAEANPDQAIGLITHSRNNELLQTWIDGGAKRDAAGKPVVDPDAFLNAESGPAGSIYKIFRDEQGVLRMADVSDEGVRSPGLYTMEHGTTPFDAPPAKVEGNLGPNTDLQNAQASALGEASKKLFAKLPLDQQQQIAQEGLPRLDLVERATNDYVWSGAYLDFMKNYTSENKEDSAFHTQVVNSIADPAFRSQVDHITKDLYGATPEERRTLAAGMIDRGAQYAGQVEQVFSAPVQNFYNMTVFKQFNGTPEEQIQAQETLKILKDYQEKKDIEKFQWGKASNIFSKAENVRRSLIVGPLMVMFGNAKAQGYTYFGAGVDAAQTGLLEGLHQAGGAVKDLAAGEKPTFDWTKISADMVGFLQATQKRLSLDPQIQEVPDPNGGFRRVVTGGRGDVERLLNALPLTKSRLIGGMVQDTDAQLFGKISATMVNALRGKANAPDIIKALPFDKTNTLTQNILAGGQLLGDTLNRFNYFQEIEYRKALFDGRFRGNIKRLGLGYDEAIDQLWNKGFNSDGSINQISPGLRNAAADAEIHALQNTFALDPEGGLLGGLLKGLKQFDKLNPTPAKSTVLLETFPRFVVNNILWQMHHNPGQWFDIMDPAFREKLSGALDSKDPAAHRDAMRMLGRANTGMLLLGAGYHLANGGQIGPYTAGSSPTKLRDGQQNPDGTPREWDTQSFQPLSNYLVLGKMIHSIARDQPFNMSSDDWSQFLTNARVSDEPLPNLSNTFRDADSSNAQVRYEAIAKFSGKYLGSWLNWFRASVWDEVGGAMLHDPTALQHPDIGHQPIAGPVLKNLAPGELPPRFDPFMNQVATTENMRQHIMRSEELPIKPLAEYMTRAGEDPQTITKDYQNPIANDRARRFTGYLLNNPEGSKWVMEQLGKPGQTIDQAVAPWLSQIKANPSDQMINAAQFAVSQIRGVVHKQVNDWMEQEMNAAIAAHRPTVMSEELAEKIKREELPLSSRDDILKQLKALGLR